MFTLYTCNIPLQVEVYQSMVARLVYLEVNFVNINISNFLPVQSLNAMSLCRPCSKCSGD